MPGQEGVALPWEAFCPSIHRFVPEPNPVDSRVAVGKQMPFMCCKILFPVGHLPHGVFNTQETSLSGKIARSLHVNCIPPLCPIRPCPLEPGPVLSAPSHFTNTRFVPIRGVPTLFCTLTPLGPVPQSPLTCYCYTNFISHIYNHKFLTKISLTTQIPQVT